MSINAILSRVMNKGLRSYSLRKGYITSLVTQVSFLDCLILESVICEHWGNHGKGYTHTVFYFSHHEKRVFPWTSEQNMATVTMIHMCVSASLVTKKTFPITRVRHMLILLLLLCLCLSTLNKFESLTIILSENAQPFDHTSTMLSTHLRPKPESFCTSSSHKPRMCTLDLRHSSAKSSRTSRVATRIRQCMTT